VACVEVLNMTESKGKEEEKKPRGGRRKNGWGSRVSVSNEIYKFAKEASSIGKETSKAGYYNKKY